MTSTASKVIQTIKPYVPLIRFRKGGPVLPVHGNLASDTSVGQHQEFISAAQEWWMTPEKFRRKNIDEFECEIINMGGRDKPFE